MKINSIEPKKDSSIKKTSFKGLDGRAVISALSKPASDSLVPTASLEVFVTGGRGLSAYKRGGKDEFRERFIDDTASALFWMKGVDMFNALLDKIGVHFFKMPAYKFDTGEDALRTPFKNLAADIMDKTGNIAEAKEQIKKISAFKFSKIIAASLLSTSFIGFVMPKINQKITEKMMLRREMHKEYKQQNTPAKADTFEEFTNRITKEKKPSFKGIRLVTLADMLENNTICKMLTNDAGIMTGRTVSSRNKDEGLEYLFRDFTSLFFYFGSTPAVYKLLQYISKSAGLTDIDPVSAKMAHENLKELLKRSKNGSMTIADFEKHALGALDKNQQRLVNRMFTDTEVITLNEFKQHIKDSALQKKAEAMAALQPEKLGEAVLTRQQAEDVLKNGSITNPEFMQKIYTKRFGKKLTDPYQYIPMKRITAFRENIDKYVKSVIDAALKRTVKQAGGSSEALKQTGMVDISMLEKINKKSFALTAGFRIAAIGVSALALGFIIPKLQYMLTEKRTGSKEPPGLRQYKDASAGGKNKTV